MKIIYCLFAAVVLAFTGCKNITPATQRIIETQAVATGVELGVLKAPTARPYLEAVTPIVCAEAAGTNPSPAMIVAAIEASGAANLKTPEAVIIVNGALGIYAAVVSQFGTNSATMQNYAGGLCDGLTQGLAFSTPTAARRAERNPKTLSPHVQ